MLLIVLVILIGGPLFFAWRRSPSRPKQIAAKIGGVFAILFLLLGIYDIVVYYRTLTP